MGTATLATVVLAVLAAGCAGQDGAAGPPGARGPAGAVVQGDAGPQAGLRWRDRTGAAVDTVGTEYAVEPGTGHVWRVRTGYGSDRLDPTPALDGVAGEEAYSGPGCTGDRLVRAPALARWTLTWPGSPHLTAGTYVLADDAEVFDGKPASWEPQGACEAMPAGAALWAPVAAMLPVTTPDAWYELPLRLE